MEFLNNNIETIIMILTQIIVWILGALSKKNENIKNDMIIFQNGIVGLISCFLYYVVTKDFSVAIATSGLTADIVYNLVHSSYKLIKRK
jgi:predicted histidine transporter YuiF (NhaC family)